MTNFVGVTFPTLEIVHPTSVRAAETSMSKVFKFFFDKLNIFFELGAKGYFLL